MEQLQSLVGASMQALCANARGSLIATQLDVNLLEYHPAHPGL
jgi:hypothetical protein